MGKISSYEFSTRLLLSLPRIESADLFFPQILFFYILARIPRKSAIFHGLGKAREKNVKNNRNLIFKCRSKLGGKDKVAGD